MDGSMAASHWLAIRSWGEIIVLCLSRGGEEGCIDACLALRLLLWVYLLLPSQPVSQPYSHLWFDSSGISILFSYPLGFNVSPSSFISCLAT